MKYRALLLLVLSLVLTMVSCNKDPHFITDRSYRAQVHEDFEARKIIAQGRSHELFDLMDTLNNRDREAMEFLYAYMPYSDLADYEGAFFLKQTRAAFAAHDAFSWGKIIPEDVFRHFVLVYRVNNEDLDTARLYFFNELKDRVKGLSMYDAALEVNHWCHEHVAYRAADSRTSSPLATMRTSLGRCGEESTFAVTALRSVGIPARQCYTPRWAHCDDNHAWVEVWIDGKWMYLGACEPDPELNMGWFDIPATRTMMVHSNAFGRYVGKEEVNFHNSLYAKINMLPNYTKTKKIMVTVKDPLTQKVISGAEVKFKLYNYSEYYTLATVVTDEKGQAQLTTGLGDLLIWALQPSVSEKPVRYNYVKVDVRTTDKVEIYLSREAGTEYVETLDIVPPEPGVAKVTPTAEQIAANALRIAFEDSLRGAYVATFPTEQNYKKWVNPNANMNDAQLWDIIRKSEGNYVEIANFLNRHTQKEDGLLLNDYLCTFSDKDMRDISVTTLEAQLTYYSQHVNKALSGISQEVYVKGLLPARISNELVRPWRTFLTKELSALQGRGLTNTVQGLKAWTLKNISVDDTGNYYNCPISPMGVFQLRHSDAHSRDIFFVAACRSMNIPAYLDNATNGIYVFENGKWQMVALNGASAEQPTASLTLTYKGENPQKPVYWSHFTLAKYQDGDFVSFDFENDPRMNTFPATLSLEPGYYLLSTGARYPEGDAMSRLEFFEVKQGQKLTKEIVIRPLEATNPRLVTRSDLPTMSAQMELFDGVSLADYAGDKGVLFVFLGDYREPSKHLVKELQSHRSEFKHWGGMTYLVAPGHAKPMSWKLPNTDCFIAEASAKDMLREQIIAALKTNFNNDYPLVALVNNKGQIVFHSKGYSIGLAEQILKHAEM